MALTKVTRNLLSTGIDDQSTSTAITIDSSGNVGIGNSSPLGKLTISNAAGANAPTTVTAANTYLQLGSDDYGASNNGKFMIGFGYTDATNTNSPAYIGYEETSTSGDTKGELTFYTRDVITDTAPSERMRIDSSGNVGIGTNNPTDKLHVVGTSFLNGNTYVGSGGSGNIYLSAGTGIYMDGGTTSANHLDDYEEGTWTPVIRGSGVAGSYTYSLGYGVYTKIGRQVTISFLLLNITEVSAGTGYLQITGCPFTKGSSEFFNGTVNVESVDWFNSNTYATLQFTSTAATSTLYVRLNGDNYVGSDLQISELVSGSSDIGGTITFFNA